MIDANSYRTSPEDEYDEAIMYAGWNPDVALLVYQQQRAHSLNVSRQAERLCDVNEIHLPYGQHPFAK